MKWKKTEPGDHAWKQFYWWSNLGSIGVGIGEHGTIIADVPGKGTFKLDGKEMQEALKELVPDLEEFDHDFGKWR